MKNSDTKGGGLPDSKYGVKCQCHWLPSVHSLLRYCDVERHGTSCGWVRVTVTSGGPGIRR